MVSVALSYVVIGLATYLHIAAKAFQQLNVVGSNYLWITPTSFVICTLEFYVITEVVTIGWGPVLIPVGAGGSLGCMTSMYLHRWLTQRKQDRENA